MQFFESEAAPAGRRRIEVFPVPIEAASDTAHEIAALY